MAEATQTKNFTITTSPAIMRRIERFLALLHFASGFGHSGIFGMELDGDGSEKVKVADIDPRLAHEVDAISGVGYDVELARDNSYSGKKIDRNHVPRFYTGPAANLYRDGDVCKTIPSCDWQAKERQQSAEFQNRAQSSRAGSLLGAGSPDKSTESHMGEER